MEWQLSLTRIATSKGRRFVQVDFSATPYNDVGSGRNRRKVYFPHIIADFDLKTAMRQGLVRKGQHTASREAVKSALALCVAGRGRVLGMAG